ncbi:MAG: hypothetical protein ACREVV_19135 [Steroidobacteraceae bacterium]
MSPLIIAGVSLLILAAVSVMALWAWLQITRDVVAEEGDEDAAGGEGTPEALAVVPEIQRAQRTDAADLASKQGNESASST